jgi:uncharacterized protein
MEIQDFELKSIKAGDAEGERGTFTGMAATYDLDQGGDKIVRGAFTKTLAKSRTVPLLWQHESHNPIGTLSCTETSLGLAVEGKILLSDPVGKRAYDLMKEGVLKGLSIGYTTVKDGYENGVRLLKEIKLFEISIVTFPMNEAAMIASVKAMKAMSDAERGQHLKSIDHHRRAIDRHQRAMRENMKALFGDEMFADDDDTFDDDTLLLDEGESLDETEAKELARELNKMLAMVRA